MQHPVRLIVPACLAMTVFALLAGCASPSSPGSIMDRVDANRAAYESWPLEVKQAILDGHVIKGMTPDMVRVALGKPTEVVDRGGGDEVWVYRKGGGDSGGGGSVFGNTGLTVGGGTGGVYVGGSPTIMTGPSIPTAVEEDEVVFRDGVVSRGPGIK